MPSKRRDYVLAAPTIVGFIHSVRLHCQASYEKSVQLTSEQSAICSLTEFHPSQLNSLYDLLQWPHDEDEAKSKTNLIKWIRKNVGDIDVKRLGVKALVEKSMALRKGNNGQRKRDGERAVGIGRSQASSSAGTRPRRVTTNSPAFLTYADETESIVSSSDDELFVRKTKHREKRVVQQEICTDRRRTSSRLPTPSRRSLSTDSTRSSTSISNPSDARSDHFVISAEDTEEEVPAHAPEPKRAAVLESDIHHHALAMDPFSLARVRFDHALDKSRAAFAEGDFGACLMEIARASAVVGSLSARAEEEERVDWSRDKIWNRDAGTEGEWMDQSE
ncbi:unnamed protein product [Zymoseptoria tritici ST99CH_1A5]|uniref:Uncharacterized protein n=2 Tax=Zymoseptoria tritici TaxID=1047171 RepID=A0A2H1H8Z2_ZYMTR|nr:unnamed protein product [Zymoseptoria tritici ST99CH_1E4]SMY30055.1 unnamed protein product [Zymoseptoria tritici ST99CH_1A5]